MPAPAPAGRNRTRVLVAGAVVLVLVVAGLFVLTRGGDDEEASDDTELSSVPATDAVVTTAAPDVVTTVVETTEAPATTIEETTTVAPTTTAPPTTQAPSDQLVAALPTLADFPAGWTGPTAGTTTDPAPRSGPRVGFCGGGDDETRAIAAGMDAYAGVQAFVSPDGIYVESRLYGFPSAEAASAFIGQTWTDANACPDGFSYQLPEGEGEEGTYNGFEGEANGEVIWTFTEQLYPAATPVAGADEYVQVAWLTDKSTVYEGTTYGDSGTRILQFERYGSIVIGIAASSWADPVGYESTPYVPHQLTMEEFVPIADSLRPGILDRLAAQGLI